MNIPVLISIILLLVLLIVGIPVPTAFFGTTLFLVVACDYTPDFLVPYGYAKTSNYVLLAMPLFIIAGGIIEKSDLGAHLVNFVNMLVGRIKGSLGLVGRCRLQQGKVRSPDFQQLPPGWSDSSQLPDDHVRLAGSAVCFGMFHGRLGSGSADDGDVLHCLLVYGPQR